MRIIQNLTGSDLKITILPLNRLGFLGGDNKKGHGINRDPFIYMVGDAGFEPATPAV